MILYCLPIRPEDLASLERYGKEHMTPLVAAHSTGFYSYFRIHLPGAFPIVDTHPDATASTDLRLLAPWPELSDFARGMTGNIDSMNDHDHGHLPYIVILLHYLDRWREAHDGKNPSTYKEKMDFRQIVSDATRRNNPEGGEENFEEAVAAVVRNIVPPSLPSSLGAVFKYRQDHPVSPPTHCISASLLVGDWPTYRRSVYRALC